MGATYKLEIDTERDGTYGSAIDDITPYWTGQASWNAGMADGFASIAQPASLSFQLVNKAGVFSGNFNQEVSGSELITNGNFSSWTSDNPNNWTVSGESGTDPRVNEVAPSQSNGGAGTGACNFYSTSANLYIQSGSFTPSVGRRYKVSLTVTYVEPDTTGGIVVKNGTTAISPVYHVEGEKTFTFTATTTTFRIYAAPGGGRTNLTIDDVSVVEVPLYYDALRIGTLCRLSVTDSGDGISENLFIGPISQVGLMIGSASERLVSITCQDYNTDMLNAEYTPALLIDVTTDQPLTDIFNTPVTPIPYGENYWMLGREGSSELGETTTLYDHAATDFETGQTVLPYAGDLADKGSVQRGVSPQMYMEDIVAAEAGGRFWYEPRTGKYTFHNRNHDPQQDTSVLTLAASDWNSADYRYGEDIINDLTINYIPRKAGSVGSVVWISDETPFQMKPGSSRKITARYQENGNDQAKVGVLEGILPELGTDYTCNSSEDGSGEILSKYLTIGAYFGAANGELWLANNSGYTLYITYLQLRGTPLTQYDEQTYQFTDPNSIARHRFKPKNMSIRMLDRSLVEQYAPYIVNRYSEPVARVASVSFSVTKSTALKSAGLENGIGTRITVTDTWSTHDADYIVIAEQHNLNVGKNGTGDLQAWSHEVTWRLKPIARETLWILGTAGKSEMGITTRLGF